MVKSKSKKSGTASKSTKANRQITTSSTAEYFSKNLQQVGFSSQTKAVLTTLKEAVDNALDACEENDILPEIWIKVDKLGPGALKNSDRILVRVEDNGPGIDQADIPKVFGEYLASSKFGRGRCSRGQQGIGISAATTWSQLTAGIGARVTSKTANMRKAFTGLIEVDIKNNKGIIKEKEMIDWERPSGTSHGTIVEFQFDGRLQINGEAGLQNYLLGNVLVNPHLTLHYQFPEQEEQHVIRVSDEIPHIPEPTLPHPHTMKLGEFIAHSHLFGRIKTSLWLKRGFSRMTDSTIQELIESNKKLKKATLETLVDSLKDEDFRTLYTAIQKMTLKPPSTQSVLTIGEEGLARSIQRIGEIDYFSVMTRKPTICDFKPVEVEVAIGRLATRVGEADAPVQVLRFANRVPLQFDKGGCAIVQSINSVNWKSYGLQQPRGQLPQGPYIFAVSVVSPFIKFKNASKETIDSSEELVEEIRRALMQAGQRLSRHLKKEIKGKELEEKLRHIEQFGPILVQRLAKILDAPDSRVKRAEEGLKKILGRDTDVAEEQFMTAEARLNAQLEQQGILAAVQTIQGLSDFLEDEEAVSEEFGVKTLKNKTKKTTTKSKKKVIKNAKKKAPTAAANI
jgi:DNA topoisomerase VI subunit B